MKPILILLTIISLASCKVCDPVKWEQKTKFRSNRSYGVKLLESGTISKALEPKRATLVSVKRTPRDGWKHLFILDNGDSVFQYYPKPYKKDSCYLITNI